MKDIIKVQDILLPQDVDLYKWAVVACDQFTSEPDYWNKLESIVGDSPSTLRLIFPEIFLGKDDKNRIKRINSSMEDYLKEGLFKAVKDSFILVERDTEFVKGRTGLMMCVDLEAYDFKPFNTNFIRATEKTIVERIPPRVFIREHAPVELPHIILLIDDRERRVIEPLKAQKKDLDLLYDTELNMNGGRVRGYRVTDTDGVKNRLYSLLDAELQTAKYGKATNFLFAVGDGNHSLATAKAHWDAIKGNLDKDQRQNHPARFALVEVMNLHDDTLKFEPIHRLLLNLPDGFISALRASIKGCGEAEIYSNGKYEKFAVPDNSSEAIEQIMAFIDTYTKHNPHVVLDFVHGREHLVSTCDALGGTGIFMPEFNKNELFDYVLKNGILPRKAFSMGEAEEKRYYMEAHQII